MSLCPNCGKELANDAVFCTECGATVEQQVNNQDYQQNTVSIDQMAIENQYQNTQNQQQYQSIPNQPPYQTQYQYQYQANAYNQPITEDMLPPEYKPVSIGAYVGYSLLFSIPVVGFIMMFIVGFGSSYCKSLRNFAKSYLVMMAISIALVVLFYLVMIFLAVFMGVSVGMMDEFMYY